MCIVFTNNVRICVLYLPTMYVHVYCIYQQCTYMCMVFTNNVLKCVLYLPTMYVHVYCICQQCTYICIVFTNNVRTCVLYLSCNVKMSAKPEKAWVLIVFNGVLYHVPTYTVTVSYHHSACIKY
jgi:hypothetical protein